jgi:hypothetical protein
VPPLDVPAPTFRTVIRWLTTHRRVHDARPRQRAATPAAQALLVLRWMRDATRVRLLARDTAVSLATAYRYLHEAIDVIAAHAAELTDVLARALREGWAFACLDGTLIPTTAHHGPKNPSGAESWYSGKHHRHGGAIQVLFDPTGYPVWVSPVEPGSTHDLTAARAHALPALYPAAATGLATLADKGYQGAGIGIKIPYKHNRAAHPDDQTRNQTIASLRAVAERGNALLKNTWRALQHVSLDPWRITRSPQQPSSYCTFNAEPVRPGENTSVEVMSPEFKASFDLLLLADRDGVDAMLGRAEERIYEEDLSNLADPEREAVFEGLTPPRQLLDGAVQTANDVDAAVARTDWRWRLDVICALIDYVD